MERVIKYLCKVIFFICERENERYFCFYFIFHQGSGNASLGINLKKETLKLVYWKEKAQRSLFFSFPKTSFRVSFFKVSSDVVEAYFLFCENRSPTSKVEIDCNMFSRKSRYFFFYESVSASKTRMIQSMKRPIILPLDFCGN